ncbi:MAG: alpha/beta hydrolase domain-containing protein [Nocardioides sp.]
MKSMRCLGIALVVCATVSVHPVVARAEAPVVERAVAAPLLSVARPTVTPIPSGVRGRPFVGLLKVPKGYVQSEFLVSGIARPYSGPSILTQLFLDLPDIGTENLPPLPYTTRVVVVRPRAASQSNGAAVVTWHNVTFGHDIGEWFNIGGEVVSDGWTYVEASVQLASVPALKAFDPVRYATVSIPGDAYSFDIYSQIAQALRHGDGHAGRPLGTVVALGASQSGRAMDAYLADVQPLYERVYDGFLPSVSNGPDHGTDRPVLRLLSENEIDGSSTSPDARTYRQWEVAGTAHGSKRDFDYIGRQEQRDLGVDLVGPLAGDNGPFGTSDCLVNRFPAFQAHNAALAAMLRWIRTGTPPTVQPRVRVKGGAIQRNRDGNAIGGLRYPAMAVPTAAYNRTGDCVALDGRTERFDRARLATLYPTAAAYRRAVNAAVRASRRAGLLTGYDARDISRRLPR